MKMLMRNLKIMLVLFFIVSASLLIGLSYQQYRSKTELYIAAGENKAALRSRYAQAGTIFDSDGLILAQSVDGDRVYCEDSAIAKSVLHIVGDYTHNIGNTVEASYQGILLGNDRNIFRQFYLDILGKGLSGDDITLTISGDLSKKAYNLLDGRNGSVVLLNYKTGAVLCSVSSPSTSPSSVIAYEDITGTVLFNRALSGAYAPGSTFKIITSASYLTSNIYDPSLTLDCESVSTVEPNGASESGEGHGEVNFMSAFARSCNVFFGQVGVTLGNERIMNTARVFGYETAFSLDRLSVKSGKIEVGNDPFTLSWLSIGQPLADSTLYTTPLHMAMIAGAIGNDGTMQKPHIIEYATTPSGENYMKLKPQPLLEITNPATAGQLEIMMIECTKSGTGTAAAISGYTVASKTGTVQVDGQKNNALCVAYIVEDDMPYAVAVIVEEGGSGGGTAAPIAGDMLSAAVNAS